MYDGRFHADLIVTCLEIYKTEFTFVLNALHGLGTYSLLLNSTETSRRTLVRVTGEVGGTVTLPCKPKTSGRDIIGFPMIRWSKKKGMNSEVILRRESPTPIVYGTYR